MVNVKGRLTRLEKRYGVNLDGSTDPSLMSPNELLDNISNMLVDVGVHPDEAEKQISHLRIGKAGDKKPDKFAENRKWARKRSYSDLSNQELKDELIRVAAEIGITFPDFEVV